MGKWIAFMAMVLMNFILIAQEPFSVHEYANFAKYAEANMAAGAPADGEDRVVFMGNSITESWVRYSPAFFEKNAYIGRGISGQVTHQMLLRFRADVIDLNPKAVVILAGINDIAQNSGFVELMEIFANIKSKAELAAQNGIKVVLCSVLPAIDFPWRPGLEPAQKVVRLNQMIRNYAAEKDYPYVDYFSAMADDKDGLKVPEYTSADDLVHPNKAGYDVMEGLVQKGILAALGK